MKKITSFFLILAGATCFAQSSIFVMNNYNHYDAVGRFMTASPNPVPAPYMYSAPNGSFGMYTIPKGFIPNIFLLILPEQPLIP